MTNRIEVISTEDLLHNNPIIIERNGWYHAEPTNAAYDRMNADLEYSVKLADSRRVIGHTGLIFHRDTDEKELYIPKITSSDHLGRGFGLALHVAAAQMGEGTLRTSRDESHTMTESALRVWRSLTRRGLAKAIEGPHEAYRFLLLQDAPR